MILKMKSRQKQDWHLIDNIAELHYHVREKKDIEKDELQQPHRWLEYEKDNEKIIELYLTYNDRVGEIIYSDYPIYVLGNDGKTIQKILI